MVNVFGSETTQAHGQVGNSDGIKDAFHFCDNPVNSHVRSS